MTANNKKFDLDKFNIDASSDESNFNVDGAIN